MRTVSIFGNTFQSDHIDRLRDFFKMLAGMDVRLRVQSDFAAYLAADGVDMPGIERVEGFPADTDIAISIGGDGTFLRTAEWIGDLAVPVMGINTGHLGYLAGFSLDRPTEVLEAVSGIYELSPRMRLELECSYIPEGFSPLALNEVSISKGDTTSMVSIRAYIDDRYVADYQADGLVISTPTGSTAYNLSCGGPIVQPTAENIILTPIAPHSLTLRPLVIGAGSRLRLEVSSRGEECHVGVDGRTFAIPSEGVALSLRRASSRVYVVLPGGSDFASILRAKLRWGERLVQ